MVVLVFFFFNDTATTEIYTLSLHDALPIYSDAQKPPVMKSTSLFRQIASLRKLRSQWPVTAIL